MSDRAPPLPFQEHPAPLIAYTYRRTEPLALLAADTRAAGTGSLELAASSQVTRDWAQWVTSYDMNHCHVRFLAQARMIPLNQADKCNECGSCYSGNTINVA